VADYLVGPQASSPASSYPFTQGTVEPDKSNYVAFNAAGGTPAVPVKSRPQILQEQANVACLVADRLTLRRSCREAGERFLFIPGEHDVARESEHFEKLNRCAIDV
jgi:hypothetical protein